MDVAPRTLRCILPPDGNVLALVNDHPIPVALLEIASVLLVSLERVDRDDDLVQTRLATYTQTLQDGNLAYLFVFFDSVCPMYAPV